MTPRQFQRSCCYGMPVAYPKAPPALNISKTVFFPRWLQREGGFNG